MIVWLASYPRSGNTMLRVILKDVFGISTYSIHGDDTDIAADEKTAAVVGHLSLSEDFDIEKARDEEDLYVIKTHELIDVESDQVIYIVRDGRDACVSYCHYTNQFSERDVSLIDVIHGNVHFGSWSDHVRAWNKRVAPGQLLLVRFEDLLNDLSTEIDRISEFTSWSKASQDVTSFEQLHAINPSFFRKGQPGAWESAFGDRENTVYNAIHGDCMRSLGYQVSKLEEDQTNNLLASEMSWLAQVLFKNSELVRSLRSGSAGDLERIRAQRDEKVETIRVLRARVQQMEKDILEYEKQVSHLQRSRSEHAATSNFLRKKIESLQVSLAEQQSTSEHLMENLRAKQAEMEEKLRVLFKRNSHSKNVANDLRSKIDGLENRLRSKANELEEVEAQLTHVMHSRRMRFICMLLAPLDVLRKILKGIKK